jgi:hypothetical protein
MPRRLWKGWDDPAGGAEWKKPPLSLQVYIMYLMRHSDELSLTERLEPQPAN